MNILKIKHTTDLIIKLRNGKIIIDNDIVKLYQVETRDINKAVKNNPSKFPDGYIFEITKEELSTVQDKKEQITCAV